MNQGAGPNTCRGYDKFFDKLLLAAEGGGESVSHHDQSVPGPAAVVSRISADEAGKGGDDVIGGVNGEVEASEDLGLAPDEMAEARAKLRARQQRGKGRAASQQPATVPAAVEEDSKKKKATVWHTGEGGKLSKKQMKELDQYRKVKSGANGEDGNGGEPSESCSVSARQVQDAMKTFLPEEGETAQWEEDDDDDDDFGDLAGEEGTGGWTSVFQNTAIGGLLATVTGQKVLEEADLEPVLEKMEQQLMDKNVAAEVAAGICASVRAGLLRKKLASFTWVRTAVRDALREAMERVLTPKGSIDILRDVRAARAKGRVYTMAFVGINGVGKSTSLAKVAYYLKENGINVMIAACDTFRSGAVEQLNVHAQCLDVPLFQRGYAKDPASVAKAAMQHARAERMDCVLIDTAGRMQNNEPLMRALSSLINESQPNMTVFVGEALVGNDGIDQLEMFNRALARYSPPNVVNEINGIILTKFDTVDVKVGAALSVAYKTGQPIIFVGTGQKYTHLRRLNVGWVIKTLFS